MSLTLADMAQIEEDALRKGVMEHLLRKSDILNILPFESAEALEVKVTRWDELPSVGWRKLNEGYTESSGTWEQVPEGLYIVGGDVDIDRVFTKIRSVIVDPEVQQTQMKLTAVAFEFNDTFVNGDQTSDEDQFNGLKYRVDELPSRMTVDLADSGDAEKVFADSASQHEFLDGLHELVYKVGGADALFMNEDTYLKIHSLLRRSGLLDTTTDQFDRTWDTFMGAKLVDVGFKADQSTEIITSTEDPGDGGNDSTSIYGVRFGLPDGLIGTQVEALDAYVVAEELEAKPVKRIRIDWVVGLAQFGDYSVGRLKGFKMAAS